MKICVYAISKNESKFVDRWVESMKEADAIYVLDTGSTDNTVDLLESHGVNVTKKVIDPWRFDVARNLSLDLVPDDTDICVCTDLDEVFEKGWRSTLEKCWNSAVTRASYNYNWSIDENGKPIVNFNIEKIHNRHDYKWIHPVHEVLTYIGNTHENKILIDDITLNHYPDSTKSRGSYLPLLELSVKEDPEDDRNMHYLGREYMYYGRWNDCIDTLIKHLNLKRATWKDERCASMRFIARSYQKLGRLKEARMWLELAIKEAPHLRDPYIEMALLDYDEQNWDGVLINCLNALKISGKVKSYINEAFSYNETPYDLLSLACYNLKLYDLSLYFVSKALEINPKDERLLDNKHIIEKKVV